MNNYINYINDYKLKEIFIASYITFNFINREISNIFLITVLLLCLIDYRI